MNTRVVQIIGDELAVVWSDGHESYYRTEELRRSCPCANCAGEADFFGRLAKGAPSVWTDRSFALLKVEPTGNYALTFHFADGHSWGIWTFDRLRSFCSCLECQDSAQTR